MAHTFLKDHFRTQFSGSSERHLTRFYPESRGDTGHTGQFRLLVADIPATVNEGHGAIRHQFDHIRFLTVITLAATNGEYYRLRHLQASTARFSSSSISLE